MEKLLIRKTTLFAAAFAVALIWIAVAALAPQQAFATLNVTVTDAPYNAVGDGTTNDRAAIQQAIDDVTAAGGGTVTLPSGHTFLSGNLTLKDNVTLLIDTTAVLKQSQATGDYTYTPVLGHYVPNSTIQYNGSNLHNYPLIFADSGTTNVKITGEGTILMTNGSTENTTIHVSPIGFYRVDTYEISDITIKKSNAFHIMLMTTKNGLVSGVTLTEYDDRNTDGILLMNGQNIHVTGNTLDTIGDDGIDLKQSYNDPRGVVWWSSSVPQPTKNIEIDHNYVHVICCKGQALMPHGVLAPDLSQVEMSNISIHDNTYWAGSSVGCWCSDYYAGGSTAQAPMKDFTFYNNTYIGPIQFGDPIIMNLSTDFGKMSPSEFWNGDFEGKMNYWSHSGTDTQAGASDTPSGQDGSWFGYIRDFHLGDTSLFEGLGLYNGYPYKFTAKVQSSGATGRMFVYNTCTSTTAASLNFNNTSWETKELTFIADGTCSNYHLGIDNGSSTGSSDWLRIDSADLELSTLIIDNEDPQISYTGTWQEYTLAGDMGGTHRTGKANGSYAEIAFTGTNAKLLGIRNSGLGEAKVYVDGVYQTTIDLYHPTIELQYVMYDTGTLAFGNHTVKLEAAWTKSPLSTGYYIGLDAVVVGVEQPFIIDNEDAGTSYSGTWQVYSSSLDIGGTHRTGKTAGSYAEIAYTGSNARIIGILNSTLGEADVYVDGVYQTTIDLYNPTLQYQSLLYDTGTSLTYGSHTIKLEATGTKNALSTGYYIGFDALEVDPY